MFFKRLDEKNDEIIHRRDMHASEFYSTLGDSKDRPNFHGNAIEAERLLKSLCTSSTSQTRTGTPQCTPLGTLLTDEVHGKLEPDHFSLVLSLSHSKYLRLPPLMGSAMTSGTSYSWLAFTCSVKAFRRDSLVLMMSSSSASVCTFPSHQ